MAQICDRWYILSWLLIACLISGCVFRDAKLKNEMASVLGNLPEPPDSVLLSESETRTGGTDSRCDGHLVSRLYGTNQSIERIVEWARTEFLVQSGWSLNQESPNSQTMIALVREGGFKLAVNAVDLRPELLKDPFFLHKEVQVDQPYETIYLFNVVHLDSAQVEHCWGQ